MEQVTYFDLKVGYTCNNRCKHCVIERNKLSSDKMDETTEELFEIIDGIPKSVRTVVLTGGEVTVRKDFLEIVSYVHARLPEAGICIQTNGRNLYKFLPELKKYNIFFVVAIHSHIPELHDEVTDRDNSFNQTWGALEYIRDNGFRYRTETVLSSLNKDTWIDTVDFLVKEGFKHIGISYPHMDGWYIDDKETAEDISLAYDELGDLNRIRKIATEHTDILFSFEEFPRCLWGKEELPAGILLDGAPPEGQVLKFPGSPVGGYADFYSAAHRKGIVCEKCDFNCNGIWWEAYEMFGERGLGVER